MNVFEALGMVKEDFNKAAYRASWNDDPTIRGTVIVHHNSVMSGFAFYHSNANPPEYIWDDDARIGAEVTLLFMEDILATDWEVRDLR